MAKNTNVRGERTTRHAGEPERKTKSKAEPEASPSAHPKPRIFSTPFGKVYPLYVQKAERRGRKKEEVDEIISWLTGYSRDQIREATDSGIDFETFFARAPRMNPNMSLITGVICGVRVEEIVDPLMQRIRYLDKLVDELARGKAMTSILRR